MKRAVRLASLSSVDILLAFAIQLYVLITIGPGIETDSYVASQTIPVLIMTVVSMSLVRVLMPLLAPLSPQEHFSTVWSVVIVVTIFFATVAVLLSSTSTVWVRFVFPGFGVDAVELTTQLVQGQLVAMFFLALAAVFMASCQARNQFVKIELIQLVTHIAMLAALPFALERYGILSVAWLAALRGFANFILILPTARWVGIDGVRWRTAKEVWQRLRPLLFGSSIYKTAPLVDRYLASMAAPGLMSLYSLSQSVYSAGVQVVDRSIVAPAVSQLAKFVAKNRWTDFRRLWISRLLIVSLLVSISSLAVFLFGQDVLPLIIAYKGFEFSHIHILWILLVSFAGYGVGAVAGQVLAGSFYAMGDTKTPTYIGTIGFVFGVLAKIAGFFWGGIVGLAIATSLYYLLSTLALLAFLEMRMRKHLEVDYEP